MPRCFASSLVILMLIFSTTSAQNWPRFRGENGQCVSSEKDLPVTWSESESIAWKTKIPGEGWSSPIVFGNRIFVTATTEEGARCHVICIDRQNGEIAWNVEVHQQETASMRKQNSFATPTPVTDGDRVYAVFFDGAIVALDFSGDLIWKNTEFHFHSLHGLGASPTLVGDQLIMPFDGSSPNDEKLGWKIPWKEAAVLSLNTADGSVNWRASRGESRVGHVTPIVLADAQQLISAGGDRVQGHDLESGELIWSIYSQGEGVTPSPVIGDNVIFTSSGFEEPTIRAIRTGGHGDVTETHIAWEQKKGVPALASPLLVRPHLYTISRDNIIYCINEDSGEIVWMHRLTGVHSASPVLADGRIYVLSEEGVTLVLKPGAEYVELAKNSLDGKFKATMAVSQGNFFLRSADHLYCIGNSPK